MGHGCENGGWCSWGCAVEIPEWEKAEAREYKLICDFVEQLAIAFGLIDAPPEPVPFDTDVPF
jgi:hypothetical protein